MYFGLMILARLKYIELGQLCVEVEIAIEKVRRYKWTGIDQITAEFDCAAGGSMCTEIYKIINSIMNRKNCLNSQNQSLIRNAIQQTAVIVIAYHCCQLHSYYYSISLLSTAQLLL